jgi:protein-disulfide isomerase
MSPNRSEGVKRYAPFVIIGVVFLVVIAAMAMVSRSGNTNTSSQQLSANNLNAANANALALPPREPQPGAPNPHVRGGEKAAVTLEEFSDFQCPACGNLHPALKRIEADYGDRIRVIFRNFPLQRNHKYALIAARAAEAAGAQGKFWEMHDAIYGNQTEWSDAPEPRTFFEGYATRLGLDVQKFKADMERQELADRVIADYNRGLSLNVHGTPTIYLNGRELSADHTLNEASLRAEIDAALNGK